MIIGLTFAPLPEQVPKVQRSIASSMHKESAQAGSIESLQQTTHVNTHSLHAQHD